MAKPKSEKPRITLASFWGQDCDCPYCETQYHWKAIVLFDGRPIATAGNSGEGGDVDVERIKGVGKRFAQAARYADTCPADGLANVVGALAEEEMG